MMGMLVSVSICSEDLQEALRQNPTARQQGKNGKHYVSLTVSINDQVDQYGKDASVWLEQSKEQRDRKDRKNFVGGGKVVYGKQQQQPQQGYAPQQQGYGQPMPQQYNAPQLPQDDDLPF